MALSRVRSLAGVLILAMNHATVMMVDEKVNAEYARLAAHRVGGGNAGSPIDDELPLSSDDFEADDAPMLA